MLYDRSSNEVRDIHRKQLEDLEIRLSNSKSNEMTLSNELRDLKKEKQNWQQDCEKVI